MYRGAIHFPSVEFRNLVFSMVFRFNVAIYIWGGHDLLLFRDPRTLCGSAACAWFPRKEMYINA